MTNSGRRHWTRLVVASLLTLTGAVQLTLVAAVFMPIDWGWQILGALGTIYGLAVFVVIGVVVAETDIRHPGRMGIATLIAALAALVGSLSWASLFGGTLLIDASEGPRIWTIIAADASFAAWLILMTLDGAGQKAPGLRLLAGLLTAQTAFEALLFLPLLIPGTSSALQQQASTSSGAVALMLGGAVLGGNVLVASWEIVLVRWYLRRDHGPPGWATPSTTR